MGAFWTNHRQATTNVPTPGHLDDGFWAFEEVWDAVDDAEDDVLDLLEELLRAPDAEPVGITGFIEQLIGRRGRQRWHGPLPDRCLSSSLWREAVAGMSLSDPDEAPLRRLRPYLPRRPKEGCGRGTGGPRLLGAGALARLEVKVVDPNRPPAIPTA